MRPRPFLLLLAGFALALMAAGEADAEEPEWNYNTGERVYSITVSADGQYIAVGSNDNKVYLFEKDSSTPLWSYTTGNDVHSVAISADGEYIAAGSADSKVYLFDKDSSTPLWSHDTQGDVLSVDISADGQYIVAGSTTHYVYLFDKDDNSGYLWTHATGGNVLSVSISADGEYIVAGSEDNNVYLFDKDSSTPLWSTGSRSMDTDLSDVVASFWGEDTDDRSGYALSGAGDVNGDGYDDFLIGATKDDDGGNDAGQTYLILGDGTGRSIDTDLSDADASFIGEDGGDEGGYAVSGAGDVNGDGYDDFLIGAPYNDDGGSSAGQTYLILGKASGWAMDTDLSDADASFIGEDAGNEGGYAVSGVGDVNGDGYNDFIIGVWGDGDGGNDAGQTYLILGKSSGWSMDTDLSDVDASFIGEDANDHSGYAVSGVGDVNDDGYDDFLIGAKGDDDGGDGAGQTYLILGKASGWAMDTDLSDADASFIGEDANDLSGTAVSGAGDVNGDGYDDFIIGAYQADDDAYGAGQTYLILGQASGWSMDTDLSDAAASFIGEDANDLSGYAVSGAGDVNGDGYNDFIIGAYGDDDGGSNAGQTYLILGKASGWSMDTDLSDAASSFIGEDANDLSGTAVSGAGDVNGDGYDDFIIGAYEDDDGGSNAGQTYLILGKSSGPVGNVLSVAISMDGEYITAGSDDDKVYLFDKDSSTPLWSYTTGDIVHTVAISADGEYIAAGSKDGKVYLFDQDSSTPLWSHYTGDGVDGVYSVDISADGEYIAVGSYNDFIYLFDKYNSTPLWSYEAGGNTDVSISSDGRYIGGGSWDTDVYLFYNDCLPVARWSFDEGVGTTAYDSSGNGNDGTLQNGPQWTEGIIGGALDFDGIDDYVEIPDLIDGDFSEFTAGAWFKLDNYPTSDDRLWTVVGGGADGEFELEIRPNQTAVFKVKMTDGNWHRSFSDTKIVKGIWYHFAGTYSDVENEIELYLNGSLEDVRTIPSDSQIHVPSSISRIGVNCCTSSEQYIHGSIDEVVIWDRALSPEEISGLYESFTGPIAYWSLDEGEGTTAYDSSGNGNDGTLQNGPQWVDGVVGGALEFDGENDYVVVDDDSALDLSSQISISAWVNLDSNSGPQAIVNKDANDNGGYVLQIKDGNTDFYFYGASGGSHCYGDIFISTDKWYLITATYDSSNVKIYVNDELDSTCTNTASISTNNVPLYIGAYGGHSGASDAYFSGYLDNVIIWNRPLSSEEISELYGSYSPPPVAHWSFDEGEGTTAYDSSGNGNDGTLQNGPQWVDGIDGGALQFDGVDDYVYKDNAIFDADEDWTISGWFNTTSTTQQYIFSTSWSGSDYNTLGIRIVNGQFGVWRRDSSSNELTSGLHGSISTNIWYHFAVRYDGTSVSFYVDGTSAGSEPWTTGSQESTDISVGVQRRDRGSYMEHYFSGTIDEVIIWNRALSPEEISELYESYASPVFIDSIIPNPVKQDYQVYFRGHGEQNGETFIRYAWRSSIDGELHNGTEANFTIPASQLTQGGHTIYFKVQNENGHWSSEASRTLTILPPNQPPTASIISVTPNPVTLGENVIFTGSASDSDGTVVASVWTSTLDGFLSNQSSFSYNSSLLSVGNHTISFRAQDDEGAWSDYATSWLEVLPPPNKPPTAVLDSVEPDEAPGGTLVNFSGHGLDEDGVIVGYLWESSRDGPIGTTATINSTNLSLGFHYITFQVVDDDGNWSEAVGDGIWIYAPPVALAGPDVNALQHGPVQFNGQGSDADGVVVFWEWDFDGNGIYEWSSTQNGLVTYAYAVPGTFIAELRVTDNDGFSSSDKVKIVVLPTVTPSDEDSLPSGSNITFALFLMVVAVIAALALRRRSKKS